MKLLIKLQALFYHYITSKGVPDYYWWGDNCIEYFVTREGPVRGAKVVFK